MLVHFDWSICLVHANVRGTFWQNRSINISIECIVQGRNQSIELERLSKVQPISTPDHQSLHLVFLTLNRYLVYPTYALIFSYGT
jgi:hypothetical protein